MPDPLFMAGTVAVPLVFGLVPGFLPVRTHSAVRWGLWLAVMGMAGWYGLAMNDAPAAIRLLAWVTIGLSATLSLTVLVAETGRPRRAH